MGVLFSRWKSSQKKADQKDIIFFYDLKSTVKHFLAGTCVVEDVYNLVRYDDYELVQHKRGIGIRSLTLYKEDGKIVGYEIVYKDASKKELKLERIAEKYVKSKHKKAFKLKLSYNEHLADIDIVYNDEAIKYIEIVTSQGRFLKTGVESEKGYTSISKIDVTQKSYMPLVAFESTFSKDGLKEIFAYRSPVRFSKRKKRRALTVNEINSLKAAPNLESLKKAQRNLELIRSVTKKSILQLKALKTFQSLAYKSESPGTKNDRSPGLVLDAHVIEEEKEDQYMEDQEFGIDRDEEREEMKVEAKPSPSKTISQRITSAPLLFINLFKRKDSSSVSSNKDIGSKDASPKMTPANVNSAKSSKLFSLLRVDSLKKAIGMDSPILDVGLVKNQSAPGSNHQKPPDLNLSPLQRSRDLRSKTNIPHNPNSAEQQSSKSRIVKKPTIEEALQNLDYDDDENPNSNKESLIGSPKLLLEPNHPPRSRPQLNPLNLGGRKIWDPTSSQKLNVDSESEDSSSDSDIDNFTDAIEKYEIANKLSGILELKKKCSSNFPQARPLPNADNISSKRKGQKRHSEALFMKPNFGFDAKAMDKAFNYERNRVRALSRAEIHSKDLESVRNETGALGSDQYLSPKRNPKQNSYLDSAVLKILSNVADKKLDEQEQKAIDPAKLPIRRSSMLKR